VVGLCQILLPIIRKTFQVVLKRELIIYRIFLCQGTLTQNHVIEVNVAALWGENRAVL